MTTPKLPRGELSRHPSKGFRLTCGTHVSPDGKRRPKVFWLGHDKCEALLDATKIRRANPFETMLGGWTKEYEKIVREEDTVALIQQRFMKLKGTRETKKGRKLKRDASLYSVATV